MTWQEIILGEVTDNFDPLRKPVKGLDRKSGPYPYYGASGIVDYVDDFIFDGEYLLIAEDGENLRTRNTPIAFIATGKYWVNNHAHIVRGNERANTKYLSYALQATDINGYLTGSTMPKLTKGNMNQIRLRLPEIPEQNRIVKVLGALDDKIENNRRMNETLEEMAWAIFKSWFVDFEPVHAKAVGNAPAHMDADTAALFPSSFGGDGLPVGWKKKQFGDLVGNTIGGDWGKETADDKHKDQVYIIRGTDIPSVRNNSKGKVPLRWVDPKKLTTRKLCEGDIVIEVSGGSPTQPTGRSLFITTEVLDRFDFPLIPTSFCRLMRPKDDKYAVFLHQHLSHLYQNGGTWE
jgi:type I restriction enzyme S subunit